MKYLGKVLLALLLCTVGFVIAFIIVFSGVIFSDDVVSRVATYEPVDYGNSKFHPIIKIVNSNKSFSYNQCSAFVISSTTAVTAAHCLSYTEDDRDYVLPRAIEKNRSDTAKIRAIIKTLASTCKSDNLQCLERLEDMRVLYGSLSDDVRNIKKSNVDEFTIFDINGVNTNTKAVAHTKSRTRDYGFIKGDFSKFNFLPVAKTWDVKRGDVLRTCGFPGGVFPANCTDFIPTYNSGFEYAGRGMLIGGISGGPAINHKGQAVGINTSAGDGFVFITPTLGAITVK